MIDDAIRRSKKSGDRWMQATDDTLMLNRPGMIVEPDVRKKVSTYLKKMGLAK